MVLLFHSKDCKIPVHMQFPGSGTKLCGEAHKNTNKLAIFIQCHINVIKLSTFIKLFSATDILK